VADEDVAFAGLAGQIELIRSRAVSARELVELSLRRIERIDPELNAFAAVYAEPALQQADEADARLAKVDFPPLLGIPIAVKDEIDIAGELTRRGTGAYTTRAPADAEVVRRLRAAGAIVIG
jgi:amidase